MGLISSRLWKYVRSLVGSDPASILMLGIDSSGKTTILYKVKLNETVTTFPTVGFNQETLNIGNTLFDILDFGGQGPLRPLCRHYFKDSEGLIFVVDSSDKLRFSEVREELFDVLNDPNMTGVPFVVMANKQDLPGAISNSELIDALCLKELKGHKWLIQSTCAITGEGAHEAMLAMANLTKECKRTKNSGYMQ